MQVTRTPLEGLLLIKPTVFGDQRGYFLESYSEARYGEYGIDCQFVQDNFSRSQKGVLRGLHYQNPHAQDKLVSAAQGAVFDVAVDLRLGSATYGQSFGTILSDENHHQLFVPKGFAHGFLVLSDQADFHYKCSDYYSPPDEQGLLWSDPDLGIAWPIEPHMTLIIAEKDKRYPRLKDL